MTLGFDFPTPCLVPRYCMVFVIDLYKRVFVQIYGFCVVLIYIFSTRATRSMSLKVVVVVVLVLVVLLLGTYSK